MVGLRSRRGPGPDPLCHAGVVGDELYVAYAFDSSAAQAYANTRT